MKNSFGHRATFVKIACLAGLAATSSVFAGDIILSIPGVTGGSAQESGFAGDVDLVSYSQTFSRVQSPGSTSCGAIAITKYLDGTSTSFLYAAVTGLVVPTATIYFPGISLNGTASAPYTITLTNVVVTSISQGDSVNIPVNTNNPGLLESISLTAQKFQFTFQPETPTGQFAGPPMTIGFDCGTQKTF